VSWLHHTSPVDGDPVIRVLACNVTHVHIQGLLYLTAMANHFPLAQLVDDHGS